ncbi:Syntaxin_16 [Hexamita inflata]|uniref:Syntaxin 16 n=1 Tax=Hexamita inflata TaxID=28002 RepID=A0AA86NSG3_9EUKA|nr:Syntaxin 16 [Hexamita inflata]
MDYTFKFNEMREKYHSQSKPTEYTQPVEEDNAKDCEWVVKSEEIRSYLNEIEMKQNELELRIVETQKYKYKESHNQIVMSTRFQIKQKISQVNGMIKAYKDLKIKKVTPETKAMKQNVSEAFIARAQYLGARFKDQSARFLDDFTREITANQGKQQVQISSEAAKVYDQAKQEMQLIVDEINQIVEMVGQMVACVYECGTILNRIDGYLTEAEEFIEKGVVNLKKTVEIQKSVNKLRGFTYAVIAADYVLCVINYIL